MATLNPQVPLEARQTVLDQVVAGASFTAYEITLEVRRRLGPTVEVPHSVVNSIVQGMFSNGEMAGYDRAPDTSVKAATPPFRYSPKASRGAVAATPTPPAPAFVGVNRRNLPINLRYSNPIAALIRSYSVEARAFHDAVGAGDKPFKVWLPTRQILTFRIRSFGAVPSESEVVARYSLSAGSQSNFGSKAAFAYTDEFRITTFEKGTAKTYRAALDMTLVGTVTKDGEVPTNQEDGVEIEVAVKRGDVQRFCDEAAIVFAYFRVPPRVQGGILGAFNRPKPVLKGNGWKITSGGGSLAVVGDVGLFINGLNYFPRNAPPNLELDFAPGELTISETGESLVYDQATIQALRDAYSRLENESWPLINQRLESEPNIWQAKLRYTQFALTLRSYFQNSQQPPQWRGIPLHDSAFTPPVPSDVTIALTVRPANGSRIRAQRNASIIAQADTVVFINDLGTRTGSPARLREFFISHPTTQRAYVLTFVSDGARERFIEESHFESVPTTLLSALPKPASASGWAKRPLNRIPFDPAKHVVLTPRNSLLASFPILNDGGYADLERWVRDSRFDGKQWPDFKRLYKKAEARVWPIQKRTRWKKTEAELPAITLVPDEREAFLLGTLMGHLDSAGANRNEDRQFPHGGPTAKTVAYMVRRTENLLRFLQRGQGLSEERRALLAPLVAGSMMRAYCGDINDTVAFRLGLQESVLEGCADLVQRVWSNNELAVPVLRWAFEWLRAHGETIEGTPRHARRFLQAHEEEMALYLLPRVLESGLRSVDGYSLTDVARDLQNFGRRGEALRLFARFPSLKAREQWIWSALNTAEANELEVVRFVTPLVEVRAQSNEWEVVPQLAPALRQVFFDAFVATHPRGMRESEWRTLFQQGWMELFFPLLQRLPMSPNVAQFLWDAGAIRAEWIQLGGEAQWVEAYSSVIRDHARQEDFDFAVQLPPVGRTLFFQELLALYGDAVWTKFSALDANTLALFTPDLAQVSLSDAFWRFLGSANNISEWMDAVGRERATDAFSQLSAPVVRALLESGSSGLEPLIAAWLSNNAEQLSGDEPLLMLAATSLNEDVRSPALARLRQLPLNLRTALRLMESGLPEAQALARPYFENEGDEWAIRSLALIDSPKADTRVYGLDLLSRFSNRWTSNLLRSLAQHDDTRVQAFVAAQLEGAPEVAASEAVTAFDSAIINSRGRSRRAKTGVQRRLTTQKVEEETELDALLDAARNGAARDRAWALQQLVRLQLSGIEVPELQLSGALASASN